MSSADTPPTGDMPAARPARQRGECIDRYLVVDTLGAGGMGVVYKAFDPELGRPIALKLLRGEDDSGTHRERLLREAQALAQLSHPNVIAVHDVGTVGTDVFIAMEFVEGQTLRKWRAERTITQREILDAYLAAGEGLAAAHRAGLVHRDFKPDNVIVGQDGRVRVLDFGLARAAATRLLPGDGDGDGHGAAASVPIDETVESKRSRSPSTLTDSSSSAQRLSVPLTLMGSVLGTPRYMAPEQHKGDHVDERGDQFSFCASLYEALYGGTPFTGRDLDELSENVLSGRVREAPAGSRVPRWLRQVLLRGLAVRPADRYPSMQALLAALRADPKIKRRRWLPVGVLVLLAGSVTAAWQVSHRQQVRACAGAEQKLIDVWDPARRAAVRSAFRRSGLAYAEVALTTVERVFDGYAKAWVAMHTDTCEATHVRGEQSADLLDLRMSCLDDRLMQLRTLAESFSTADAKLVERATQSAQSLPGLDGCANTAALRAPMPAPRDGQTARRIDEVRQQLARASALGLATRYEEGIKLVDEALKATDKLGYPPLEAEAQLERGGLHGERGEFVQATQAFHRAFVAAISGHHDELAARASTELIQTVGVAQAHYEDGDRWAEVAEAWVHRFKHEDAAFGAVYTRRSILRKDEGRYDEALRDAQRALEVYQRVLKPDDYRIAEIYQSLGNIHYQQGHYAQAIEAFQHSLRVWQQSVGPDHPKLIPSLVGLAGVYGDSGEHERAIAEYEHMLEMLRRVQADHPSIANIYNDMGNDLLALGRHREAFEQFQRALQLWRKRLGPSRETVSALLNLGDVNLAMEENDEALRFFQQALSECEQALGPSHSLCGIDRGEVGEAYRRKGRLDEALEYFNRSLVVLEKSVGPKHPTLVLSLFGIGRIALARHTPSAARPPLERALAIREVDPGDGIELAGVRFALAQALWATGERPRALELATRARDGYATSGVRQRKPLAEVTDWVAHPR